MKIIILNSNSVFRLMFMFLKAFMNKEQKDKFEVYSDDSYREYLQSIMPLD
jgi:hypothetical protein